MTYTEYEISSGRIVQNSSFIPSQRPDRAYLSGEYKQHLYIVDGKPSPRPSLLMSINKVAIENDGVDEILIQNIPESTLLTISGTGRDVNKYLVEDGEVRFSTLQEGTVLIQLELFPYLPTEFSINVY